MDKYITGKTLNIPISSGKTVQLYAEFPLKRKAWNQMMDILNAMKPGLVKDTMEITKKKRQS